MLQPRFNIEKRSKLPRLRINPDFDSYFFPFFPASGTTLSTIDKKFSFNSLQWEQIFTGRSTIIMRWIGSEDALVAYDKVRNVEVLDPEKYTKELIFKRQIKKGDFHIGKILNQSQSSQFLKRKSYLRQKISTKTTVYFNDGAIWDFDKKVVKQQFLYLFWKIPEVNDNDLFYIESANIILDFFGNYICHLVNFATVGEKLNEIGIFIDQKIQYSAPGEAPVLPEVSPKLNWISTGSPPLNDSLFYEPEKKDASDNFVWEILEKTKAFYINKTYFENAKGIKYIQFEFEGLVGIVNINFFGYEKEKNQLLKNRSIPIFLYENKAVSPNPLNVNQEYNDSLIFLGNWGTFMRFWFSNWKQDFGLFFNPKATRDEQGAVESFVSTWAKVLENKNDILSAQQNSTQEVELTGWQSLALNPFTKLFFDKLDFNTQTKKIEPSNQKKVAVTFCEFLNTNRYLNQYLNFLEIGIHQLKNSKELASAIVSDLSRVLGVFSGFFLKGASATPFRSGLTIFSQIFERTMAWLPNEFFTTKNALKLSTSFNFAISKDFCEFLAASLPNYSNGKINPAFIPFDFFKDLNFSGWSQIIGTRNLNQSFNFELTEKVILFNKKDLWKQSSSAYDLIKKTHVIDTDKLVALKSNNNFVIQMLELKVLGFRNCTITFRDENNQILNSFSFQTQNKFTGNAKDITQRIIFDWSTDNEISLDEKFRDSFINQQELVAYVSEKIDATKTKAEYEKLMISNTPLILYFIEKNKEQKVAIPLPNKKYSLADEDIFLEIQNIWTSLLDKKTFWTHWKNPLNTEKNQLLEKIFPKLKINFKIQWKHFFSGPKISKKAAPDWVKGFEGDRYSNYQEKINLRYKDWSTTQHRVYSWVNWTKIIKHFFSKALLNEKNNLLVQKYQNCQSAVLQNQFEDIFWDENYKFSFNKDDNFDCDFVTKINLKKETSYNFARKQNNFSNWKTEHFTFMDRKFKIFFLININYQIFFDETNEKIQLKAEFHNCKIKVEQNSKYLDFFDDYFDIADWWIKYSLAAELGR